MAVKNSDRTKKLIGIFGGTFDPIHRGHLRVIKSVQRQLKMDRIILVPCHHSALRVPPVASPTDRLKMVKLATKNLKYINVDAREIKSAKISYTFDTLQTLRQENPNRTLALIIGVDAFNNFHKWKKFRQILQLAHLIVVDRPGQLFTTNKILKNIVTTHKISDPSLLKAKLSGCILFLNIHPLPIAATQIRHLIKNRQSAKKWLPTEVWKYLKSKDKKNIR